MKFTIKVPSEGEITVDPKDTLEINKHLYNGSVQFLQYYFDKYGKAWFDTNADFEVERETEEDYRMTNMLPTEDYMK